MMTLQNMTTPLRALLPAALMLLAATACEDTLDNPAAHTGNGPALTLVLDNNEDNAGTRTQLNGSDATHHVRTVDILIFQGKDDNATYVGKETVDWPQPENTVDAQPVNRMEHTLKQTFNENENYILLGVGKDDQFDNTYNIEGQTLGQTYAKLKEDKGKDDIAACEFFTGTVSFTYTKEVQIDDLLMKRRVAGVMLYVTEIPQQLTESDGAYRVTKVQLCLGPDMDQNKTVLLKREFDAENWTEPAQEALDNSNVLAEIDLSDLTYTSGEDFYMKDGEAAKCYAGLYMLPLNATEGQPTFLIKLRGKKDDGSGALGEEVALSKAFVVENHSEGSTSFPVRSNYIYCIGEKNEEEGIDEPVSLSGTAIYLQVKDWVDVEDTDHNFGLSRMLAVFDDANIQPYNCRNDWHIIRLLPPVETMYPYVTEVRVTVNDIMEVDESDVVTGIDGRQINYDELFNKNWLYIRKTAPQEADTKETKLNDTYVRDMTLYKKQSPEDIFNPEEDLPDLEVFVEDYARPRKTGYGWENGQLNMNKAAIENIKNDTRKVELILYTTIDYNGVTTTRQDVMTVEQYNTITVYYTKDVDGVPYTALCGFNREDLINVDPGVISDEYLFEWGYGKSYMTNSAIYPFQAGSNKSYTGSLEDGAWNVMNIVIIGDWEDNWIDTAPYKAQYICYEMQGGDGSDYEINQTATDIRTNSSDGGVGPIPGWYLPAEYEMEGLMQLTVKSFEYGEKVVLFQNEVTNLRVDHFYWTSTADGYKADDNFLTRSFKYDDPNTAEQYEVIPTPWSREEGSNNRAYVRQARHFEEQIDRTPEED